MVTLLIIIIVFTPFEAFILCYLYTVLPGPLDLILLNLGAIGSESNSGTPQGEVFYEAPIVEDFGWQPSKSANGLSAVTLESVAD